VVPKKTSTKKRLKLAKGQYGGKSRLFRTATDQSIRVRHMLYATEKSETGFPRVVIARINRAVRAHGLTLWPVYQRPEEGQYPLGPGRSYPIMAIKDATGFEQLVGLAKQHPRPCRGVSGLACREFPSKNLVGT